MLLPSLTDPQTLLRIQISECVVCTDAPASGSPALGMLPWP